MIEFDVETVRNRDQAIKAIEFLIKRHNIKQDELYPQWIACSDRIPKEGQEVVVGWLHDDGRMDVVKTVHEIFEGWWVDNCFQDRSEYFYNDDFSPVINPPTHWHPIPTL